ncbi:MAG: hypothetical protein R8G66_08595 [Cytophagales bacterium]|nr:hypothetical protein [Cytophagales bacterium]
MSCSDTDEADPKIVPLIGSSCNEEIGAPDPCPDEIVCQLFYSVIRVSVVDEDGEPVILDETELRDLDSGEVLAVDQTVEPEIGYVIAADYMTDFLPREGHCLQLTGYINGQLALQYSFLVGHDCCHVVLLAGPSTLTLTI